MIRKTLIALAAVTAAACGTLRGTPQPAVQAALPPDHYVVFFSPKTAELASEAQTIVREAAVAVRQRKPSKIEIAVPARVPGGPDVVEGRYTAIQNIIASTGADPMVYSRVVLSSDAAGVAGGADRAEIRLLK